jgi:hypothetical protein
MANGTRIKSTKGSALNLSPLARLLRLDQLVPLMFASVFIMGKKMLPSQIFALTRKLYFDMKVRSSY